MAISAKVVDPGLIDRKRGGTGNRTVREISTEIPLVPNEGLPDNCVASFDDLQNVLRRDLSAKAGQLEPSDRNRICLALEAIADCAPPG